MDTNFAPETGTDANNKVSTTTNNSLETPVGTLDFNKHAKSKVGTFTHHKPGGGDKKIPLQKLDFRTKATSRIGSLDNAKHKPQGGGKKVRMITNKHTTSNLNSLAALSVVMSMRVAIL